MVAVSLKKERGHSPGEGVPWQTRAAARSVEAAFRAAVAAGTAAVITPATALCDRADVERFEAVLERG